MAIPASLSCEVSSARLTFLPPQGIERMASPPGSVVGGHPMRPGRLANLTAQLGQLNLGEGVADRIYAFRRIVDLCANSAGRIGDDSVPGLGVELDVVR